jgi:cytochrome c-type biogenesis protein CcmH
MRRCLLGILQMFRRRRSGHFVALLLGAALLSGAVYAPAQAVPKKDASRAITDGIICPCSCGEILTGCTCETGKAMRAYVEREVGGGKTKDQVEAALVQQYGEVILGAPKAKGFNTVVWVAPIVATLLGFFIASFVLVRWARRRNEVAAPAGGFGGTTEPRPNAEDELAALRARAEEELRRLRE